MSRSEAYARWRAERIAINNTELENANERLRQIALARSNKSTRRVVDGEELARQERANVMALLERQSQNTSKAKGQNTKSPAR